MFRYLPLLALLGGCFHSLVDDPCIEGYHLEAGRCIATTDDPDTTDDVRTPDPTATLEPTCTADTSSDPDNCGACGRSCTSGICEAGHCAGTLSGHVIAIGHDYGTHNGAMARVLGNAVALGAHHDVAVARWSDTGDVPARSSTALAQGMTALARPWHLVPVPAAPALTAFAGVDVLLVEAQTGDGDTLAADATPWAPALDRFLQDGGVVIVLAGAGSTSHRFAAGAGLATWPEPVDASSQHATIADATDSVTQQVVSPYLAAASSAAFPNVAGPIVAPAGTIVIHETRY